MTAHSCCSMPKRREARNLARRFAAAAEWLIPSAVLALMPKCPACVAAYVTIATGFGISMSVASSLRMLLILFSVVVLCMVAAKWLRRRLTVSS